jgi:hypothetical protein
MTYAIFSIVANQVSPSGCSAYTYAQGSYNPYIRGPFYQMSEQLIDNYDQNGGIHPAYPFLTGYGGAYQVVLFGYLGLRLLPDDIIHIDPNLPPQIPYLKYRGFYWRGWFIQASSNYTHTVIERASSFNLNTADPRFSGTMIPVHVGLWADPEVYQLAPSGKLIIRNRQTASEHTILKNLIQCRPVQSYDSYQPGQFPIAAIDGATSTKWQPSFAANISSLTVSLSESQSEIGVSGFHFNWAEAPPTKVTVMFHNISLPPWPNPVCVSGQCSTVLMLDNITISDPYDPNSTGGIALLLGNFTNVTLSEPVPIPRFATLFISGNQALSEAEVQANNGTGATVAEWAILAH